MEEQTNEKDTPIAKTIPSKTLAKSKRKQLKVIHDVPHYEKSVLRLKLADIISDESNADVEIVIGEQSFKCHSALLRHYSELFQGHLVTGSVLTLPTCKVTVQSFKLLLQWMLEEQIKCPREQLIDLLKLAKYLRIPSLMHRVINCFADRKKFTIVQLISTFFEACNWQRFGLAQLTLELVRKYFLLIVGTSEYRELKWSTLYQLLKSNALGVHSEVEVFYAAIVWLLSDIPDRRKYVFQVMSCVRFTLFSPHQLSHLCLNLHELLPELIDEMRVPLNVAALHQQELRMLDIYAQHMPLPQRLWVRDPMCPYWDLIEQQELIGFQDFMDYIESLECGPSYIARLIVQENYK